MKSLLHPILILLLSLLSFSAVQADELHVIANGKAYHFDRNPNWNESNWGFGFEYDFEERHTFIPFFTGSTFKDSNKQTSNYVGGGVKRRYMMSDDKDGLHFDLGLVAFLMTRHDYKNNDPFFGALPFVSVGNDDVALNVAYIPKVTPKSSALVWLQVMFKVAEF